MVPTLTFAAGILLAQTLEQRKETELRIISTALAFLAFIASIVITTTKGSF